MKYLLDILTDIEDGDDVEYTNGAGITSIHMVCEVHHRSCGSPLGAWWFLLDSGAWVMASQCERIHQ